MVCGTAGTMAVSLACDWDDHMVASWALNAVPATVDSMDSIVVVYLADGWDLLMVSQLGLT